MSGGSEPPQPHWEPVRLARVQDDAGAQPAHEEALALLKASAPSTHFERPDGSVVIAAACARTPEAFSFVEALGECGDARCTCYRLSVPAVRASFVDLVVGRTLHSIVPTTDGPPAVRYVTLGCGALLTDAQILAGLVVAELRIESIVAVDSDYFWRVWR
eukprot:4870048-Prymnesium_polylepis.2